MRARTAPQYLFPILLGLWLLAGGVVSASSLPDPVVDNRYPLRMVGAGELRWLGFPIYDASLWTSSGRHAGFTADETVALSLWYRRSFTRDELLKVTETAWRKLGQVEPAQRERSGSPSFAASGRTWRPARTSRRSCFPAARRASTISAAGSARWTIRPSGRRSCRSGSIQRSVVSDLRIRLLGGPEAAAITAAN